MWELDAARHISTQTLNLAMLDISWLEYNISSGFIRFRLSFFISLSTCVRYSMAPWVTYDSFQNAFLSSVVFAFLRNSCVCVIDHMCKLVDFFWNSLFHRCSQYDHFCELPLMLHPLAQEQSLIKSGCFCSPSCDLFPGLWWPQNTHHARHACHAQTGVSNIPNLPELLASISSIIINDQKWWSWWSCHRNVIGIILSPLSTWWTCENHCELSEVSLERD